MKILKNLVDILRIFLSLVIFYFIIKKIAFGWSNINTVIMVLIVYLPALFFLIFKSKYLAGHPKLLLTYKIARILFIIWLVAVAVLFTWRWNYLNKTQSALDKINNAKITMDDVTGTNLPPEPNKTLNDSTIAGFDVNNNGIRDDVELAIFAKYPNSAKIRAGMLQYAQALQLELTEVISEETMIAYLHKDDAAYSCLMDGVEIYTKLSEWKDLYPAFKEKYEDIKNLVLNTETRKEKYFNIYKKYMTTYASTNDECMIDLSMLPN